MLGETKSLVSDYALLAVLDARRAALRLAWLLGTVLVAAVLVVTAWLALVASGQGTPWPLALGIAAVLNLVGAGALAWWMKGLASEMPFNAVVRSLRGDPPPAPPRQG